MAAPTGAGLFLTRIEVAEILRVSPLTVFRLVHRGVLPVYRVCRKLLFKRNDVLAFAEQQRHDVRESTGYGGPQAA